MNDSVIKQTLSNCEGCDVDTYGIWEAWSEDAFDLKGVYEQKSLGYFEGVLIEVLEYVENFPDFYQWGDGGYLTIAPSIGIKDIIIVGEGDIQTKRRIQIDKLLDNPIDFLKKNITITGDKNINISLDELSDLLSKYKFY